MKQARQDPSWLINSASEWGEHLVEGVLGSLASSWMVREMDRMNEIQNATTRNRACAMTGAVKVLARDKCDVRNGNVVHIGPCGERSAVSACIEVGQK
jgi:hypothetical protein